MTSAADERFMALALAEAARVVGRTHPDPVVGAVFVKRGKVIAHSLAEAGRKARGATLYSTLEPNDLEALHAAGVSRVVFGSVASKRRAKVDGLEVLGGVLAEQTDALNRPYFKFVRTGLPFVTVKAGVTLDGKLATANGESKWITSDRAREAAHRLRDRVDAVIVGAGTVVADDPKLTTRLPEGGRTPVRVVLDPSLRAPARSQLFAGGEGRVIVVTTRAATDRRAKALRARGVELWSYPRALPLEQVLRRLAAEGLLHVLVEGGAATHARFLSAGLADELVLFVAPKLFGHDGLTWSGALGVATPPQALRLGPLSAEQLGNELVLRASVLEQR